MNYLKTSEAAQILRMSLRRVQEHAQAGNFPGAIKPFGRILIPAEAVEEMKKRILGGL